MVGDPAIIELPTTRSTLHPWAVFWLLNVANGEARHKVAERDIIDAAKREPGKLNWAIPVRATQHLTGELFTGRGVHRGA